MAKSKTIIIRIEQEMHERLMAEADRLGITISELVRIKLARGYWRLSRCAETNQETGCKVPATSSQDGTTNTGSMPEPDRAGRKPRPQP